MNDEDEKNQRDRKKRSREPDEKNDRKKHHRSKQRRRHREDIDDDDWAKRRKRDHKKKRHRKQEEDDDVDSFSSSQKKKHPKNDRKKEEKRVSKKDSERSKKESTRVGTKSKIDKSKLYPLGDPLGHPPSKLLDPESDYFAFHKHLWLYLYRECGTAFNDLTSTEQARSAFADFCRFYNAGSLEAGYYSEPLPTAALEECKTSSHKWKIQISDREDKNLQLLQEGVLKQTEYQTSKLVKPRSEMHSGLSSSLPYNKDTKGNKHQQESNPEERRRAERITNRRLREHIRTTEEELLEESGAGKKHGRERLLEKRKELAVRIHGAARDREDASNWELDDDGIYGDREQRGFKRALEVSKRENARRRERQDERVAELERKEKEKQAAMLEILGLKGKIRAGEKIQIAPRNDG